MPRSLPLSLPGIYTPRPAPSLLQAIVESAQSNYSRENARSDDLAYWPVPLPTPDVHQLPDPLVLFLHDQLTPEQRPVIPMTIQEILERRRREQLKPSMQVPLGLIDKPELLQCNPLLVDLHAAPGGPLLLVGPPHSGKATAIQTLLLWLTARFLPTQFRCAIIDPLHELDFFQELPHLLTPHGALLWTDGSNDDSLQELIDTLNDELLHRSTAYPYQSWHEGTLAQLWKQGVEMPQILLIINNYQTFCERTAAASALKKLAQLIAEMRMMGVYLVLSTTGISSCYFPTDLLSLFANKIVLQLPSSQFTELSSTPSFVPEAAPGRGFFLSSKHSLHEIQLALPVSGATEQQRYEALKLALPSLSRS